MRLASESDVWCRFPESELPRCSAYLTRYTGLPASGNVWGGIGSYDGHAGQDIGDNEGAEVGALQRGIVIGKTIG